MNSQSISVTSPEASLDSGADRVWVLAQFISLPAVGLLVVAFGLSSLVYMGGVFAGVFCLMFLSLAWVVAKLVPRIPQLILLALLVVIPVIGWVILLFLVANRAMWFLNRLSAVLVAVAQISLILFLPTVIRPVFSSHSLIGVLFNSLLCVALVAGLLSTIFSRGYSAYAFVDIFLSLPTSVVLLAFSAIKVVSHSPISGAGHNHSENNQDSSGGSSEDAQNLPAQYRNVGRSDVDVVESHLRTSPDGIKENNLSYDGPNQVHNTPDVVVKSHLRSHPDGITENNLGNSATPSNGLTSSNHLNSTVHINPATQGFVTENFQISKISQSSIAGMIGVNSDSRIFGRIPTISKNSLESSFLLFLLGRYLKSDPRLSWTVIQDIKFASELIFIDSLQPNPKDGLFESVFKSFDVEETDVEERFCFEAKSMVAVFTDYEKSGGIATDGDKYRNIHISKNDFWTLRSKLREEIRTQAKKLRRKSNSPSTNQKLETAEKVVKTAVYVSAYGALWGLAVVGIAIASIIALLVGFVAMPEIEGEWSLGQSLQAVGAGVVGYALLMRHLYLKKKAKGSKS
jgi:hypothetical protein